MGKNEDIRRESQDPLEEVNLGTTGEPRFTYISQNLSSAEKRALKAILFEYRDCFAWEHHEMPGVTLVLQGIVCLLNQGGNL